MYSVRVGDGADGFDVLDEESTSDDSSFCKLTVDRANDWTADKVLWPSVLSAESLLLL